jgi:CubicO group peptidase (beta-lactamase class C family)
MHLLKTISVLLAVFSIAAVAPSPSALKPGMAQPVVTQSASATGGTTAISTRSTAMTKADVDAWLDGFMPYALAVGDIGGGVVVIVKDGKVLTLRGFGFADVKSRRSVNPETTLFRPGSTSKLFTWTAVMQQVEAGKIDLDRDINDYLDFKIPPAFGKPITMRHLMTHTAGFEETAKYLILFDKNQSRPLGEVLRRFVPKRVYAPGSMAAYSNYGASLAGYIVQRVSGEPFDTYIQRHILSPIGMTHSTFNQPLPPALLLNMATGYNLASQGPQRFEIIDMAPAGALSSSGSDMAKFMIAHLSQGAPLLKPETAKLMYATANTPIAGLPGMALGFYHEDRNGLNIIGHGGDTNYFHSDLHLYLDKNVGMFISVNSGGKENAAHVLRERLFHEFTDRYFPNIQPRLATASTAKAHGAAMAGHYITSRGSDSTFLRLISLIGQSTISVNEDDTITVSALTDSAGVPKIWREVCPWQWVDKGGTDHLNAVVKDGRVVRFAVSAYAPIISFLPAPAAFDAGWIIPVMVLALVIILLTALSWPITALIRRKYKYQPDIAGRVLWLHRISRITAWVLLAITCGWLTIISALSSDVATFDGRLDPWMRLLQLLLIVAIVGTVVSIWNVLVLAKTSGRRGATLWSAIFALAALFLVWLAIDVRLLTLSLDY